MLNDNYSTQGSTPYGDLHIPAHNSSSLFFSTKFFDRLLQASGDNKQGLLKSLGSLQYAMILTGFLLIVGAGLFGIGGRSKIIGHQSAGMINLSSLGQGSIAGATSSGSPSPAPSSTPVSASALSSYTVAPNLPRYLIIPSISVDARVLSVGVTSSGNIAAPGDIYDTAWYNGSSEPGQPGAMVIDGHISSWTAQGVFYNLAKLVPGDIIQVESGGGTIFNYKVVKSQVYPSGNVNMPSVLSPVVAGQPGLNLITCTGQVIAGTSEFNERLVVFATEVSS